jgi:hypothetical protein
MATVTDSARIASMAKRRKSKSKIGKGNLKILLKDIFIYFALKVFASNNEIDVELSPTTKEFIEKVHHAYIMHLKVFICRIDFYFFFWLSSRDNSIVFVKSFYFCFIISIEFTSMYST